MNSISLLVPVYNEEKFLKNVLDKLLSIPHVTEYVLIDDGSRDDTPGILKRFMVPAGRTIRVVTHAQNIGKGAAIRSGIEVASSEYIVVQDADSEYNSADLSEIFKVMLERKADVVFGSRFLKPNPHIYPLYLLGNKFLTWCVNLLAGGCLTDAYTGYKAMSTFHWKSLELRSKGFEIEAEIATKCLLQKLKIAEVPVSYQPRTFSEGKKIRAKDALKGIMKAIECRVRS